MTCTQLSFAVTVAVWIAIGIVGTGVVIGAVVWFVAWREFRRAKNRVFPRGRGTQK